MRRKVLLLSLSGVAALVFAGLYAGLVDRSVPTHDDAMPNPSGVAEHAQTADQSLSTAERQVKELAVRLLEEFGGDIDSIRVQAQLLDVQQQITEESPESGAERFRQAVHVAFPDQAESILETIAAMREYRNWVEANQRSLGEMGFWQRQSTLWEKRRDLFGEDAEALWEEERRSAAARERDMQEVLERLDGSHETTLEEKLYQLDNALDEVYGYGVQRQAIDTNTLNQTFFGLESVQSELAALPPDERQEAINDARRQLGVTEDQIARLEERDKEREQRWQRGYDYMDKRESIERQYEGEQKEQRLNELRREHFEHEAETIALEEEDGFFRFKRDRVYGRN